jgi:putative transposase
MKRQGLVAIHGRRKIYTTDSNHRLGIAPNLLQDGRNRAKRIGEVFVQDITYIPLRGGGFCYLACLQDKYTRRIAGWKLSKRMGADLAVDVVGKALRQGWMRKGAILHSDRGVQYASNDYRKLLAENGLQQSMSRKGNCYDNAQAESLFSRIKAELMVDGMFETFEHARSEIGLYIDGYYNRVRRHSALGYKSPLWFEKQYKITRSRGWIV